MKMLPALLCIAATLINTNASAQEKHDNGTDPTKVSRQFISTWEYMALAGGFSGETLKLTYSMPLGAKQNWSAKFRLPVAAVDVLGNGSYGIGDASVQIGRVFGLSRKGGYVAQGELVFDTAGRPELGTGKNVLKGTLIKAYFLESGGIFAPAMVQSNSLWGRSGRADVNTTTFDFYYVPKLEDKRNLVTLDPSVNLDWENDKQFLGLALTYGRVLGPAWGGNAIVSIKPSVFAGGDRPSKWGVELGFKVIGF